jgi:hypothetical protein
MKVSSIILLSAISISSGFAPIYHHAATSVSSSSAMRMSTEGDSNNDIMSRRKVFGDAVIKTASVAAIVSSVSVPSLALAEGEEPAAIAAIAAMGTDALKPISVIGAGGKVGNMCTELLTKQGLYTRAVTRSGRTTLSEDSKFVTYASGDVTNYEAIKKAVDGSSGVIFAASASGKKKGGDPEHVDYLGLYYTAKVRS